MEYSLDLTTAPGVIWASFSGEAEYPPAELALREVWATQKETGLNRVIWDLRKTTVSGISAAQLKQLAGVQRLSRPELPPAKAAFLVENDLLFGLGRMITGYFSAAPVTFQVFRKPEEAVAWLEAEA